MPVKVYTHTKSDNSNTYIFQDQNNTVIFSVSSNPKHLGQDSNTTRYTYGILNESMNNANTKKHYSFSFIIDLG